MAGENPTWWSQFEKRLDSRFDNLDERFTAVSKALDLQADEYSRRLEDLNHAHARALEAQTTFLSAEKFEDYTKNEAVARKIALERLDEKIASLDKTLSGKLESYITRYEARQREIDTAIDTQKGAAAEAKRAAEEQGRKNNRNIGIATIVLTIIIALSNWFGSGDPPTPPTPTQTVTTTTS